MSARLPREFAQHAETISRRNPIAFPTVEKVRNTMRIFYDAMLADESTVAMATGGILFRRDGDGDIELWVSPSLLEEFS